MLENKRILVIDDDVAVCDIVVKALNNDSYEIMSALNGEKGLDMMDSFDPDLIILDLRMPKMDGYEFLKEINLRPTDPYSVIILTGDMDDEAIKNCFAMGVYAFLRKPFNKYELRGLVKHTLDLEDVQTALVNEIQRRAIVEKQLREDRLHFMSLAKDKLTPERRLQRMREMVELFEGQEDYII